MEVKKNLETLLSEANRAYKCYIDTKDPFALLIANRRMNEIKKIRIGLQKELDDTSIPG